jgi:hypothetical protein
MEEAEELEAGEVVVKEEDDDDDAVLNAIENAIRVTEAEEKAAAENGDVSVGTSLEQTFSTGMASTLNILRQQGLLATPSDRSIASVSNCSAIYGSLNSADARHSEKSSVSGREVQARIRRSASMRTAYETNRKHGLTWKPLRTTSQTSISYTTMNLAEHLIGRRLGKRCPTSSTARVRVR